MQGCADSLSVEHAPAASYNLSIVVKVSKLCLPAHQVVGVAHGEPQFKPQHCKLREGAVAHGVPGLAGGDVLQGTVHGERGRVGISDVHWNPSNQDPLK